MSIFDMGKNLDLDEMKFDEGATNPCGEISLGETVKCSFQKKRGRKKMTEVFFYNPDIITNGFFDQPMITGSLIHDQIMNLTGCIINTNNKITINWKIKYE